MDQTNVLVVGGGNAGISLAARLIRDGAGDVTLVSPSPVHRYRPLLNYVGAGEASPADLERRTRDVVPAGCEWVRDAVDAVDPVARTVRTRLGRTLHWSTLVLCPGMVEDWDATPGLQAAYADGWALSTFVPSAAPLVWRALTAVKAGSVLFTMPPEPAPCGATALKPLLMACDHWRRTRVLPGLDVRLAVPGPDVLGVPGADEILDRVLDSYGVEVLRRARVARVDAEVRSVTVAQPGGERQLDDLAFAHVVPHYRAPRWIGDSGLGAEAPGGLVDIDPETLRSRRYESIWALGDAAGIETPSSGGGLRKQVDVLARNLAAVRSGGEMSRYNGYTVMPVTVSRRRLMLVEIDREGRPARSRRLVDPFTPRRTTWLFDRYALPALYFRRILRGKV